MTHAFDPRSGLPGELAAACAVGLLAQHTSHHLVDGDLTRLVDECRDTASMFATKSVPAAIAAIAAITAGSKLVTLIRMRETLVRQ